MTLTFKLLSLLATLPISEVDQFCHCPTYKLTLLIIQSISKRFFKIILPEYEDTEKASNLQSSQKMNQNLSTHSPWNLSVHGSKAHRSQAYAPMAIEDLQLRHQQRSHMSVSATRLPSKPICCGQTFRSACLQKPADNQPSSIESRQSSLNSHNFEINCLV